MVEFGSLTAQEAGDNALWFPDKDVAAVATKTRIAGGGLQIDYPAGAPRDQPLSVPIRLDDTTSSLGDWYGAVGTAGTLATDDLSYSVWLDSVGSVRHSRDGTITFATITATVL